MSESEFLRSLRLELGKRDDAVFWRNNVGLAWQRAGGGKPIICNRCSLVIDLKERPVHYGLAVGSSDLVGVHIPSGRFLAVEGKAGRGALTPEQKRFIELVRRCGGVALEARESDDVTRVLEGLRT